MHVIGQVVLEIVHCECLCPRVRPNGRSPPPVAGARAALSSWVAFWCASRPLRDFVPKLPVKNVENHRVWFPQPWICRHFLFTQQITLFPQ
jgi:hypothetical protein